ncbi:MAG: DUF4349 domain-containing protein [Akkermansiaceae bacterium]
MKIFFFLSLALMFSLFCSCGSAISAAPSAALSHVEEFGGEEAQRKIRKEGRLSMKTSKLKEASEKSISIIQSHRGILEDSTLTKDEYEAKIRVPPLELDQLMNDLSELGKVTRRQVRLEDVTKQHDDFEAEIRNKTELRNRLRNLLKKSDAVKDTLEIEKELARVQTQLDQLTGAFRKLNSQVSQATLKFSIERSRFPGPLGIVGQGVGLFWNALW